MLLSGVFKVHSGLGTPPSSPCFSSSSSMEIRTIVCVCVQSLSHVQLFVTPWTLACQAPLSMGFPRQEYWSGLPFPSPGDLSSQTRN